MSQQLLGIDLGGTSVKFALVSLTGDILHKWSIPTNVLEDGRFIVPDMIASIKQYLDTHHIPISDIIGIGMGSPGQVNRDKGTVTGAFNLNWRDEQFVREQIESALGVPLYIDNDANLAALGERWRGAGQNDPDVVFVTLGTGVGGGIIANGELLHGKAGCAGEIGHMFVDSEFGFRCTCGKPGCLETVASATGIVNIAHRLSEVYAGNSRLKTLVNDGGEVSAKIIFDYAKQNDALAMQIVEKFAHYLGVACSHLANVLNPSFIVIGGGVSAAGDYLLQQVTSVFTKNAFPQVAQSTRLALATLGNDAGILGAAYLALSQVKKEQ